VSAAVIGTQQALGAEARQLKLEEIRSALASAEVERRMLALGADPAQVQGRLAALSDAELAQLHGELEALPAGGVLATLGVIFLVFLVLHVTGVMKVFRS
jgi:hypothetical protein